MSELAERTTQAGQTHSLELVFFPLFILIFIGIIANNYSATGLQTTPVLPTPCQSLAICYPTNTNGCDNNQAINCNLTSTSTFSFLNPTSPYAQLISGNLLGFFNCLFSCTQIVPTSNLIMLTGCSSAFITGSGEFITNLYCAGASFNSPNNTPLAPYNASSSIGNNSNWFIQSNVVAPRGTNNPTITVYATYIINGTTFKNKYCDAVGICYNTPVFTCPYTHQSPFNTTNTQYCLVYVLLNNSAPNFNNTFSVFSFIFGIVLLVIGFGLTLAAQFLSTGATIGVNPQATRMAQVFGFGLLSWSFIFSEFGSWLSNLPLNLGTIAFLTFTTMFFLGLYWRTFSLD